MTPHATIDFQSSAAFRRRFGTEASETTASSRSPVERRLDAVENATYEARPDLRRGVVLPRIERDGVHRRSATRRRRSVARRAFRRSIHRRDELREAGTTCRRPRHRRCRSSAADWCQASRSDRRRRARSRRTADDRLHRRDRSCLLHQRLFATCDSSSSSGCQYDARRFTEQGVKTCRAERSSTGRRIPGSVWICARTPSRTAPRRFSSALTTLHSRTANQPARSSRAWITTSFGSAVPGDHPPSVAAADSARRAWSESGGIAVIGSAVGAAKPGAESALPVVASAELELRESLANGCDVEARLAKPLVLVAAALDVEPDEQVLHVHGVLASFATQRVRDAERLAGGNAERRDKLVQRLRRRARGRRAHRCRRRRSARQSAARGCAATTPESSGVTGFPVSALERAAADASAR